MRKLEWCWAFLVVILVMLGAPARGEVDASPAPAPSPAAAESPAPAQSPAPAASPAPAPSPSLGVPSWAPGWSAEGDIRLQPQLWNFFEANPPFESDSLFLGVRVRGRLKYNAPRFAFLAEIQDVQMLGLPRDAIAPAPQGQLGLGASYFSHALRSGINTIGPRQLWVQLGDPKDKTIRIGRQDYSSATEVMPKDPILEWDLRVRLNERLIGPFGFSDFTRSFDGARVDFDSPGTRVTGFAASPTQGGFEPHFATHMDNVFVSNLAWTFKQSEALPKSTAQLFWLHYDDTRNVPFVDNRPAALRGRVNAQGGIRFDTYGGHFVTRLGERGDGLIWVAHQTGKWGTLTHEANAFTVELGYRPEGVPWNPWLRAGYTLMSGDGDPTDNKHGTFYAPLPTGRAFARLPVYTLANLKDLYGQLILAPGKETTARIDLHFVDLDTSRDLWYVGSGATQSKGGIFGYAGRPSQGASGLGTLVDMSIRNKINADNEIELYVGHFFGGGVVSRTFPLGDGATFVTVEYTLKLR